MARKRLKDKTDSRFGEVLRTGTQEVNSITYTTDRTPLKARRLTESTTPLYLAGQNILGSSSRGRRWSVLQPNLQPRTKWLWTKARYSSAASIAPTWFGHGHVSRIEILQIHDRSVACVDGGSMSAF